MWRQSLISIASFFSIFIIWIKLWTAFILIHWATATFVIIPIMFLETSQRFDNILKLQAAIPLKQLIHCHISLISREVYLI